MEDMAEESVQEPSTLKAQLRALRSSKDKGKDKSPLPEPSPGGKSDVTMASTGSQKSLQEDPLSSEDESDVNTVDGLEDEITKQKNCTCGEEAPQTWKNAAQKANDG